MAHRRLRHPPRRAARVSSDAESDAPPGAATESETEAATESEAETETEAESEAETEAESETETEAEPNLRLSRGRGRIRAPGAG